MLLILFRRVVKNKQGKKYRKKTNKVDAYFMGPILKLRMEPPIDPTAKKRETAIKAQRGYGQQAFNPEFFMFKKMIFFFRKRNNEQRHIIGKGIKEKIKNVFSEPFLTVQETIMNVKCIIDKNGNS